MYGEEAINYLKRFGEKVYLPETDYTTMMTLNEDIVRILFNSWDSSTKIYLKEIKENLQRRSGDYANTHEKQIAGSLRGLSFQLKRDRNSNFVVRDSKILERWLERYPVVKDDLESYDVATQKPTIESSNQEAVNSSVDNVANAGKSDKDRPKRVYTWDKLDSIRRQLLRRN